MRTWSKTLLLLVALAVTTPVLTVTADEPPVNSSIDDDDDDPDLAPEPEKPKAAKGSREELKEQITQLKEALKTSGQDKNPAIQKQLEQLEVELKKLGASLGDAVKKPSKPFKPSRERVGKAKVMDFETACGALALGRGGTADPRKAEILKKLAKGSDPEEFKSSKFVQMFGLCLAELNTGDYEEHRQGRMGNMPGHVVASFPKEEAEREALVTAIGTAEARKLRTWAKQMVKQMAEDGNPADNPPGRTHWLINLVAFASFVGMIVLVGMKFMEVVNEGEATVEKKSTKGKKEKKNK